jgi:hypothetical protein
MPTNRQNLRLPQIERLNDFIIIGHGINRLLVYLLNHVAFLEVGETRIWINRRYHNSTNTVRQIQLTREFGS